MQLILLQFVLTTEIICHTSDHFVTLLLEKPQMQLLHTTFSLPGISLSSHHLSVTLPSFETRSSSFPQEGLFG